MLEHIGTTVVPALALQNRSERPPKMFAPISDLDSEDDEDSSQTNQRPGVSATWDGLSVK